MAWGSDASFSLLSFLESGSISARFESKELRLSERLQQGLLELKRMLMHLRFHLVARVLERSLLLPHDEGIALNGSFLQRVLDLHRPRLVFSIRRRSGLESDPFAFELVSASLSRGAISQIGPYLPLVGPPLSSLNVLDHSDGR